MPLRVRVIPVLLIHRGRVAQTREFRVTNYPHLSPVVAARHFGAWDSDEIIVLNIDRERTTESWALFLSRAREIADQLFSPLTVGGWVRSMENVDEVFKAGADKIVLTTAAWEVPEFITKITKKYGCQAVVGGVDFIGRTTYISGRGKGTKWTPLDHARMLEKYGVGELLIQSIEHDGASLGYKLQTSEAISRAVNVPCVYLGGVGKWDHLVEGANHGAHGVGAANIFHYSEASVKRAKDHMRAAGINARG